MKYMMIFEAFDFKRSGEWHSGSCSYYKSILCDTKELAEEEAYNTQYINYENNTERYRFSFIIIPIKEEVGCSTFLEIEEFIKYIV